MSLYYGNTQVKEFYYNNTKVKEMYYNNTLVYKASILDGTLAVGNLVTFDNKTWRVVHNNGNKWYLALSTIAYTYIPGGINVAQLHLITKCEEWLDNFSDDAKKLMVDVTIDYPKYTCKVFIPTYAQVSYGGNVFSYYKNNIEHRKCQYNGAYTSWWTCTMDEDGFLGCITESGDLSFADSLQKYGFRPHMCITV